MQLRLHDAICGTLGEALVQLLVQFAGAEHEQRHLRVEVGAVPRDSHRLAHHRATAVAADAIGALDHLLRTVGPALHRDPHARRVLLERDRRRIVDDADVRQLLDRGAKHLLDLILRQTLVRLRVEGANRLTPRRRVPPRRRQVAIGRELADGIGRRHETGRADLIDDAPELEVLERALREVLALGDRVHLATALDERALDAAQPEVEREAEPDWPCAYDDDVIRPRHASSRPSPCPGVQKQQCTSALA